MSLVVSRRLPAVLAVALLAAACTSGGPAAKGTTPPTTAAANTTAPTTTAPPLPAVLTAATPAGWVPVDFGDSQISVPATWQVIYTAGCPLPRPSPTLYVGGGIGACPGLTPRSDVVAVFAWPAGVALAGAPRRAGRHVWINGLTVVRIPGNEAPYHAPTATDYRVPALGIAIVSAGPDAARVVGTLTRSPAAVVLARGPAPAVPKSWKWVTAGDLRFAVPGRWDTGTTNVLGPACDTTKVVVGSGVVVLDSDQVSGALMRCAALNRKQFPPQEPANGVVVDLHPMAAGMWPPSGRVGSCLHLGGTTACVYDRTPSADDRVAEVTARMAELDILFVAVTVPGHAGYEMLEIGLAGNGKVARTILRSLRAP
jgi:hypothetical protein